MTPQAASNARAALCQSFSAACEAAPGRRLGERGRPAGHAHEPHLAALCPRLQVSAEGGCRCRSTWYLAGQVYRYCADPFHDGQILW